MRLLLVLFIALTSIAADHYVLSGGGCTSNCNSWSNASNQITTALSNASRGDTIWVGDGTYTEIRLEAATSGDTTITIKKAIESSHGTGTGWSSAYGDGQATIASVIAKTDYYVLDGQTRNESNWADTASYGFRITSTFWAHTSNYGSGSSYLTLKYLDVGGPVSDSYSASNPSSGFYFGGFAVTLTNWTIHRCRVHNVTIPFQLANAAYVTIEYTSIGPNWGKEAIRGQGKAHHNIIRHNVFDNACQGNPDGDGTCTAQIAMWDGSVSGDFDNNEVYGNLFWHRSNTMHTDACILFGSATDGPEANHSRVYNNTIVGVQSGQCILKFTGGGVDNIARNNIWYGLGQSVGYACGGTTCSDNALIAESGQFLNAATGDFRLTSALAGYALDGAYSADMEGRARGSDGVWDRGAYEYGGIRNKASSASTLRGVTIR